MAIFAKLDSNNIVIDCLVFDDNDIVDNGGHQSDQAALWVKNKFGKDHDWAEGSGDGSFRGQLIEVGGEWFPSENIFKRVKYFPSWVWDSIAVDWKSPIGTKPIQGQWPINTAFVKWNEPEGTWYAYVVTQEEVVVTNSDNQITSVTTPEIMQWHAWDNTTLTWGTVGNPITKVYII